MFGLFIIAALGIGFIGTAHDTCAPLNLDAKECVHYVKDHSTPGGPYNE